MIGDSTFTYLVKNISPQTWRKIKALGIYGIEPEKTSKDNTQIPILQET